MIFRRICLVFPLLEKIDIIFILKKGSFDRKTWRDLNIEGFIFTEVLYIPIEMRIEVLTFFRVTLWCVVAFCEKEGKSLQQQLSKKKGHEKNHFPTVHFPVVHFPAVCFPVELVDLGNRRQDPHFQSCM